MKTDLLRTKYLDFFKKKKHKFFPSDTLVPDDESLLFTSAGMNQFKKYFLGEKKDVSRATSCQKCLRTGDLERVGKTAYHHTFFEMLGNFSFGDYFKKEAIGFAWEFLTKELKINEDKLWVSVYEDDQQAYDVWKNTIKVSENKIVKLGADSNFWPANAPSEGPNGPCGPCSEIFFDQGENVGCRRPECDPDCSCGRFVEIWNLVFTQFNRVDKNKLEPLPQKNIDTGMGLERMACVLQAKKSNFEIDILAPLVEAVQEIIGVNDLSNEERDLINAIVDHARAAVFSISDGIYPSNEERGYVIRKIIRKASWSANLLGYKEPFLYALVSSICGLMGKAYPEIKRKKDVISKVIKVEEEKFLSTLKEGKEQLIAQIKKTKQNKEDTLSAQVLFRLYDTYGFPIELSKELVQKNKLKVDEGGFEELLRQQQERSRGKSMFDENIFKESGFDFKGSTKFKGYQCLETEAKILDLMPLNISQPGDKKIKVLKKGQEGLIVLDQTCFYPESGGQLTDEGIVEVPSGEFKVDQVFMIQDVVVHRGRVITGEIKKGKAKLSIDIERRKALMRAHTATHLLQAVLRKFLGQHVTQQGSLVDKDKFRFDFTHFKALSREELDEIENKVNSLIFKADKVFKDNLSFEEAKKQGALAFFKDKYQDQVRVVSIGNYSKELCGGTHLDNTSQIGFFLITSESSISSGIRRIEAVVGNKAYREVCDLKETVGLACASLKTSSKLLVESIKKMKEELKSQSQKNKTLAKEIMALKSREIIDEKEEVEGINFLNHHFSGNDYDALLYLADMVKKQLRSVFIFLSSSLEDKNIFICAATEDLVKKGITSKKFVNSCKDKLFLKGGGRDNLAKGVFERIDSGYSKKIKDCFKEIVKL